MAFAGQTGRMTQVIFYQMLRATGWRPMRPQQAAAATSRHRSCLRL